MTDLGFVIHPVKSVLRPVREIRYLGFLINSTKMQICLPPAKCKDIIEACTCLESQEKPTIRKVAQVIGKIVAAFPAVPLAQLHYRCLEKEKTMALQRNHGHFDRRMTLSHAAKSELQWWICELPGAISPLSRPKPHLELRTDASGSGWGATDLTTHAGGRWNAAELLLAQNNGINYLELLAVFHGLRSFCATLRKVHVLVRVDNTTAVAYVNHMGGIRSASCNALAKQIWTWCNQHSIWLSAAYIPGHLIS
jgi:hypothetical protein